jgi:F-type H+-transporting ATPase subunit delta
MTSQNGSVMLQMALGYGKALFELSEKAHCIEAVNHDLEVLNQAISAVDNAAHIFLSLASEPEDTIKAFVMPFIQNMHPLLRNTITVMLHSGHVAAIPALYDAFVPLYELHNGIGHVYVETAVPITDTLRSTIVKRLQGLFRLKEVRLKHSVNPDRLGGLYVEYKGVRLDASIQRKLAGLESHLTQRLI